MVNPLLRHCSYLYLMIKWNVSQNHHFIYYNIFLFFYFICFPNIFIPVHPSIPSDWRHAKLCSTDVLQLSGAPRSMGSNDPRFGIDLMVLAIYLFICGSFHVVNLLWLCLAYIITWGTTATTSAHSQIEDPLGPT